MPPISSPQLRSPRPCTSPKLPARISARAFSPSSGVRITMLMRPPSGAPVPPPNSTEVGPFATSIRSTAHSDEGSMTAVSP